MPIGFTERGFATYAHFQDTYGAEIIVRESSSAMESKVWIFTDGGGVTNNKGSVHLNLEQAKTIVAALQEWIDREENK